MLTLDSSRSIERCPDIFHALTLWCEHGGYHAETAKGLLVSSSSAGLRLIRDVTDDFLYGRGGIRTEFDWIFRNHSRLMLRAIPDLHEAHAYAGQAYTMMIIVTPANWADPEPLRWLPSLLRSSHGVPTRYLTVGEI